MKPLHVAVIAGTVVLFAALNLVSGVGLLGWVALLLVVVGMVALALKEGREA